MNLPEEGIDTRTIPPVYKEKKRKIAKNNKLTQQNVNLMIERRLNNSRTIKYIEVFSPLLSMTHLGSFISLTNISQGSSQNQRIADTIWVQNIDYIIDVTTANNDILNMSRITFLIWKLSTTLATPSTNYIFTNWTNASVFSFLNFENRENYSVIKDLKFNSTGTSTNPTNNSQHYIQGRLRLNNHRIDYELGQVTGTKLIYQFYSSDSSVTPYPTMTSNIRVWYYDE